MEEGISEKSTTMLGNLFDKKSEFFIHDRLHPHWSQDGAIVFITFRTKDSIPADVIKRWNIEKMSGSIASHAPCNVTCVIVKCGMTC